MAQKRKRLACESATTEIFASATEEAHIALSPEPAPQLQGDGKIEEEDPINDPLICACCYVASLIYLAQ